MRFSVILLFAAAALAAPFVSAQTVQPAGTAAPQTSTAATASGAATANTNIAIIMPYFLIFFTFEF